MATKKPTAKQLAARAKFVAAVKAGKFKGARGRKKNPAKPAAKRATKPAAKRAAPRKNPSTSQREVRRNPRPVVKRNPAPVGYSITNAAGKAMGWTAATAGQARSLAQALADHTGRPHGYAKK